MKVEVGDEIKCYHFETKVYLSTWIVISKSHDRVKMRLIKKMSNYWFNINDCTVDVLSDFERKISIGSYIIQKPKTNAYPQWF